MHEFKENLYSKAYKPINGIAALPLEPANVSIEMIKGLDQELATLLATGLHQLLGRAEFVVRNDRQGITFEARDQAATVGAHIVLVEWTIARVRAIHLGPDGQIDIAAVSADPPKSIQPRGHSVVRAAFLAKLLV